VSFRFALAALVFVSALFASTDHAFSHGFAGSRFFPATLSTDDPFVADELSLPTDTLFSTETRNKERFMMFNRRSS
jgi:hypothetical protein